MPEDDFQQNYSEVAEQKQDPENKGSRHLVGISLAVLLVLGSATVGVHFNYPQYAFWQPEECQYQYDISYSVEESGEKRVTVSRVGNPSVNTSVTAVGATINDENLTISDQVNFYVPADTESISVYGQCDRSATYSLS
jgi:hypothetical protein